MTDQELADLVDNVKSVTDRLTMVDQILKSEKLGQPKTMAFRCTHSGLYFPADYVKQWGITTGIGLGPNVVSETLDSYYHLPPTDQRYAQSPLDIMHPVGHSFSQVDVVTIPQDEFNANQLVLIRDDPKMLKRAPILRNKQIAKGGQLAAYVSEVARVMGQKASA